MFRSVSVIVRDPGLRLAATLLFVNGCIGASLAPYQSLVALHFFHMTPDAYALLIMSASVVFVLTSVMVGILSDQWLGRRALALASGGLLVMGFALVSLYPKAGTFVFANALILPMGSTLFVQSFAIARIAADRHPEEERVGALAAVRAAFAVPWVVMLPVWSYAYARGLSLSHLYPILTFISVVLVLAIMRSWPGGQTASLDPDKTGVPLRVALAEIARPNILLRVLLMGLIISCVVIYMAINGPAMAAAGRPTGDVALYAAGMAGLEVPFMLALPIVERRFGTTNVIAAGTVLYCCHLFFLPLLSGTSLVWLLMLPGAAGGAAILVLPIAYLQGMLEHRPGAGSSLMSMQKLLSDITCAVVFGLGTSIAGYWLVAAMGTALALGAAFTLVRLDR